MNMTVMELIDSEMRMRQIASQAGAYTTMRINPQTKLPLTHGNLRHALRNAVNGDSGLAASPKTIQANNGRLRRKVYMATSLCEYPMYTRFIWDEQSRTIMASYYATIEKMFADVRTKKKAVAFLNEHAPQETAEYWRDAVAQETALLTFDSVAAGWTMGSTNDRALAVSVYGCDDLHKNGGNSVSCMTTRSKSSLWHTCVDTGDSVHPIFAYTDSPDVRVCYIQDKDGQCIARWIAPTGRDQYDSVYCDGENYQRILAMLSCAGWTRNDELLRGCRLRVIITTDGKCLMPYIDSYTNHLDLDNQVDGFAYLTVSSGYECSHSDGTACNWSSVESFTCDCCGCAVDEDEIHWCDSEDRYVCQSCIDSDRYAWVHCRRGGRDLMNTNNYDVIEYKNEYYHREHLDYYDLVVLYDGEVTHQDNAVFVESEGEYYLADDCTLCPVTGEYYLDCVGERVDGINCIVSPDGRDKIATKQAGRYVLDEVENGTVDAETDAESMADATLDQFEYADSVDRDELVSYLQGIIDTLKDNTREGDAHAA